MIIHKTMQNTNNYFYPAINKSSQKANNSNISTYSTSRNTKTSSQSPSLVYFTSNIKKKNPYKNFDLNDKNILITGGTGTLGTELISTLLNEYNPNKIIVFSRDSMRQHSMKSRFNENPKLEFVLGDIKDKESLKKAFKNVDVVIHTAAMKHIPICEENPEEAIKINIDGVRNIIDAATETNVSRVVTLSSDKAVLPTSVYGATKLLGEKLFVSANNPNDENATKFSSIRLGNVLGSTGSIIPLFKEQSKSGKLKVTDENMARFFMTPKQATSLIFTSIESMNGGEVFLPKLKNTKIMNLAHVISPTAEIEIIGARPGERLNEKLIADIDVNSTIAIDDKYIILPQKQMRNYESLWPNSEKVSPDFQYSTDNKSFEMSEEELSKLVKQFI